MYELVRSVILKREAIIRKNIPKKKNWNSRTTQTLYKLYTNWGRIKTSRKNNNFSELPGQRKLYTKVGSGLNK